MDGDKNDRREGIVLPNLLADLEASFFITGNLNIE